MNMIGGICDELHVIAANTKQWGQQVLNKLVSASPETQEFASFFLLLSV